MRDVGDVGAGGGRDARASTRGDVREAAMLF